MQRKVQREARPPGFGAIWTTVAVDLIGFGIVLPILPLWAERFGARPATVGALVASFSVAQVAFAPLWGWVSDRVGRKPVLVLSLVGTAAGSLLTGVAGSVAVLFVGRVVDGISGASVSVAQAAVADVAPPRQRAHLFGLLGAAFAVGFVGGPAIGALAALASPRLPFLIAAGIAGVNAVIALRRLPETNPRHAHTAAAATHADDGHGGGLVAPPVEEAGRGAGGDGGTVTRLVVLSFFALTAFSAFEATFALFGERRLQLHLSSTAVVFTGVGLVLAVVQGGLVRPVVRRLGEAGTVRAGLAANAAGLLLLAAVHSWALLVPALIALVVGEGLAMPALTSSVAGRAGPRRGRLLGVQQASSGLARVVGPLLGGAAFQRIAPPAPYVGGAALLAVCAAAAHRSFGGSEPEHVTIR